MKLKSWQAFVWLDFNLGSFTLLMTTCLLSMLQIRCLILLASSFKELVYFVVCGLYVHSYWIAQEEVLKM